MRNRRQRLQSEPVGDEASCPVCHRKMVTGGERPQCPAGCNTVMPTPRPARDLRPFNARCWTAEQVYGRKRLLSDEHRVDLEASCFSGGDKGLKV